MSFCHNLFTCIISLRSSILWSAFIISVLIPLSVTLVDHKTQVVFIFESGEPSSFSDIQLIVYSGLQVTVWKKAGTWPNSLKTGWKWIKLQNLEDKKTGKPATLFIRAVQCVTEFVIYGHFKMYKYHFVYIYLGSVNSSRADISTHQDITCTSLETRHNAISLLQIQTIEVIILHTIFTHIVKIL